MFGISLLGVWISNEALLLVFDIQLNPSAMHTLGTEERGRCREVLNKSQCMNLLSAGAKKGGPCREVAVSGVSPLSLCRCLDIE